MSFSLDLSNAIGNIKENRDKIVRGTLFSLSTKIIKRTPVGNPSLWAPQSLPAPDGYVGGSLRGGWQASTNTPELSRTNRIDKSGGATIGDMANTINSFQIGNRFYLTNPLPYARRVEFGWSYRQAPQGMVRRTIKEAQTELNRLAK